MLSLHKKILRSGFTIIGCVMAGTAALTTPAAAVVDFAPNATVTATSGCVGDVFHLHTTMSNPGGGADAHFELTGPGNPGYYIFPVVIAPNGQRVDDWTFPEGVSTFVKISSDDHDPAIDFYFKVTPDCVPDDTTPTTVDETIPETTVVGSGGGLPSTGSTSPQVALVAFGLLGAGIGITRFARRS